MSSASKPTLCGAIFDPARKQAELDRTEALVSAPDFWNNPEKSQKLLQERKRLEEGINRAKEVSVFVDDIDTMFELGREGEDIASDLAREVTRFRARLRVLEDSMLLSGENDAKSAILNIHPGAGGTESQDWAEMLLRMYLRWAEDHRYKTALTDRTDGEEAGLKSATVEIEGEWAYGYLGSERGVHRLVRISPFDSSARRHTSFALVEVLPLLDDDIDVEINPEDVQMDVFRAGSAGGQHMQKNSTAVRLTHLPSGLVVICQNERSQTQNRQSAMRVLRGKLYDMELQKREEQKARLKGKHVEMGWGNQIRSYVLQPYQMVKDLRTEYEVGNPQSVLDGNLDGFMEAWMKARVGEDGDAA